MNKHARFTLLVLVFVLACASLPEPTPTASPVPEATFTPSPTNTPTPDPTSTPDTPATAAAAATQTAGNLLTDLDKLLGGSDLPYQEGYLAWRYDDPIEVSMTGPDSKLIGIDEKLISGNFVLKSEVTWNATGIIVCGVIFRSEPDLVKGRQYQFLFLRLSGLPAWAIEFHEFGYFKNSPTNVQYSSALDQGNNATNEFVLVAYEDQFTMFLNGIRQGRFFDYSKQSAEGNFAFLGSQDSGEGTCTYENSFIWSMDPINLNPTTWTDQTD